MLCSTMNNIIRKSLVSVLRRNPNRLLQRPKSNLQCQFIQRTIIPRTFSVSHHVSSKNEEEKMSLGKKFKQMSKDYWYVLIPVHLATSAVWMGGFYLMCKSGVDVGAILQTFGASEAYVEKLSNSDWGYWALAYGCYKIATPARYTVTVGGTTMTVNYLSNLGYLKTSHQVAENIKEKADTIKQDVKDKKDEWKDRKDKTIEEWKDRKDKAKEEWTDAWQKFSQKKHK